MISDNLLSTAFLAFSTASIACATSDNCSVSKTPLLSRSFTSGKVTEPIWSKRLCSVSLPVVPFGTLLNFVEASALAVSNVSINFSNSAFSLGFTKPSDVTSDNLLSTACLASSTASIACSASDNCSVSKTPLPSLSFTSGAVTESIWSKRLCSVSLPVVPSGTLFNFVEASTFAVSNVSINLSNSAFSFGFTNPSAVISDNLLSTACLDCSTASIACSASDNCLVSRTPLPSWSFTSGAVTVPIWSKRVCNSSLPVVPFGTLFNFAEASAFAVSNASISLSNSAFSSGFTKLSDVISVNLLAALFLACSTASIACSASDNCSVSNTPLLSWSFTSGAATESISPKRVCNSSLPVVAFGTSFSFSDAFVFAVSNASISLSNSAFSLGVINLSFVTSSSF